MLVMPLFDVQDPLEAVPVQWLVPKILMPERLWPAPVYAVLVYQFPGLKCCQEPLFTLMKTAPPSQLTSEQDQWSKVR